MNDMPVIRGTAGVDLGRNAKAAPEGAGNTAEGLTKYDYPGVDMADIQRTPNQGIPTKYSGTIFRSRLEARWAATFDLAGWEWVYEPFDGDGYVPDFLIKGNSPLLIEVKPATRLDQYRAPIKKIVTGIGDAWKNDVLILGADIHLDGDRAGILLDFLHGPDDWHTSIAHWVNCPWCVSMGIVTDSTSGHMRPCGHEAPKGGDQPNNLTGLWREAGNLVQWRAA